MKPDTVDIVDQPDAIASRVTRAVKVGYSYAATPEVLKEFNKKQKIERKREQTMKPSKIKYVTSCFQLFLVLVLGLGFSSKSHAQGPAGFGTPQLWFEAADTFGNYSDGQAVHSWRSKGANGGSATTNTYKGFRANPPYISGPSAVNNYNRVVELTRANKRRLQLVGEVMGSGTAGARKAVPFGATVVTYVQPRYLTWRVDSFVSFGKTGLGPNLINIDIDRRVAYFRPHIYKSRPRQQDKTHRLSTGSDYPKFILGSHFYTQENDAVSLFWNHEGVANEVNTPMDMVRIKNGRRQRTVRWKHFFRDMQIGGHGIHRRADGGVGEIIIYMNRFGGSSLTKLRSYLAVRWGVNIPKVVNGFGQVIWDSNTSEAGYGKYVAAIAHDAIAGIEQYESTGYYSEGSTIGNGSVLSVGMNEIYGDNATHKNAGLAGFKSPANNYFIWGCNGVPVNASNMSNVAAGQLIRSNRVWKARETVDQDNNYAVRFSVGANGERVDAGTTYFLLVSDDASFSGGLGDVRSTTIAGAGDDYDLDGSIGVTFKDVDIDNGQYFTIAQSGPNFDPNDADGNGISNFDEGISAGTNTDNEGPADWLDPDNDGDGLDDYVEIRDNENNIVYDALGNVVPTDSDNDAIPDYLDTDSDNDSILDEEEGRPDANGMPVHSDADGVPDYRDTNSDDDDYSDTDECLTRDGSGYCPATDPAKPGIADYRNNDSAGPDTDADTMPDSLERSIANRIFDREDSFQDGNADWNDTDSDDDGHLDIDEAQLNDAGVPADTDNDGLYDYIDIDSDGDLIADGEEGPGGAVVDTDSDGIQDYRDKDTDGDCIPDIIEASENDPANNVLETINGQTILVAPIDTDGTGIPDYKDLDSDDDNIPDRIECPCNYVTINGHCPDSDGNGVPDYRDNDSDGDNIPDSVEVGILNADGTLNDNNEPLDTDGDGVYDFADLDSDNDGLNDKDEYNGGVDTDGDNVPNYRDLDSDNDTYMDVYENGSDGLDADGDGVVDGGDADGDGVMDSVDSEPNTPGDPAIPIIPDEDVGSDDDNAPDYLDPDNDITGIKTIDANGWGHLDQTGDGVIDEPADGDSDGIADVIDNKPSEFGGSPSVDPDNDNIHNVIDLDDDGDGVTDIQEGVGVDTDKDGIPNQFDLDSDNDSILDVTEAGGTDDNGDGLQDQTGDDDYDGLDNSVDADAIGGNPLSPPDTDSDGKLDMHDLDSDDDFFTDFYESGMSKEKDPNRNGYVEGADTDRDGIPNIIDARPTEFGTANHTPPVNTDATLLGSDNTPDYIDNVPDGSGEYSLANAGQAIEDLDTNGDGRVGPNDADGGTDSDNDGIDSLVDRDDNEYGNPIAYAEHGVAASTGVYGDGIVGAPSLITNPTGAYNPSRGAGFWEKGAMIQKAKFTNGIDDNRISVGYTDFNSSHMTDIDGDGLVDILLVRRDDGNNLATEKFHTGTAVWFGNGGGNFDTEAINKSNYSSDLDPNGISAGIDATSTTFAGDLTGDGNADILYVTDKGDSDTEHGMALWKGEGNGYFTTVATFSNKGGFSYSKGGTTYNHLQSGYGSGYSSHVVDVDFDGDLDYVWLDEAGTDTANSGVHTWKNDGSGSFDLVALDDIGGYTSPGGNYLQVGHGSTKSTFMSEVTGDDYVDIITVTTDAIYVWPGEGDGTFTRDATATSTIGLTNLNATNDENSTARLADVNNDGNMDYVRLYDGGGDPTASGVYVWEGIGGGIFKTIPLEFVGMFDGGTDLPDQLGAGSNETEMTHLVDVDADGALDIVWAYQLSSPSGIWIWKSADTDGDSIADVIDVDDDNDLIPDKVERSNYDPITLPNGTLDKDTVRDEYDIDSDDDLGSDAFESGYGYLTYDDNNNGIIDFGLNVITPESTDLDRDGLADIGDSKPYEHGYDETVQPEPIDSDSDSIPNYIDLQSYGVGSDYDIDLYGKNTTANPTDVDGDGMNDCPVIDGVVDDSDHDGVCATGDVMHDDFGGLEGIGSGGDTDEDGLTDIQEDINGDGLVGNDDTDGDGIPNFEDKDDDNDGIDTEEENESQYVTGIIPDSDLDGTTVILDDPNNVPSPAPDTIHDYLEPNHWDTDGDRVFNWADDDDDGDGILTKDEDLNGNGNLWDDDYDGDQIPAFLDPNDHSLIDNDTDKDGVPDHLENPFGGSPLNSDTDGDGKPNYIDTDDDNDGTPTKLELGTNPIIPNDSDADTIPDYLEPNNVDYDDDGLYNNLDPDDDGDNIPTKDEDANDDGNLWNDDGDSDGAPDFLDKSTGTGLPDPVTGILDTGDSDGDCVPDHLEDLDGNGNLLNDIRTIDNDHDGKPNYLDNDDDGDGILTKQEVVRPDLTPAQDPDQVYHSNTNPLYFDTDGDTVPNYLEPNNLDTDGDGVNNPYDNNDDTWGLDDGDYPAGKTEPHPDGYPTKDEDFNLNGTPRDDDKDLDNIVDYLDPVHGDGTGIDGGGDSDYDGIPDMLEDINGDGNPMNDDLDGDGLPNYNDPDDDGDNILTKDESNLDTDNDSVPDHLESNIKDLDGDTIPDYMDVNDDGDPLDTSSEDDPLSPDLNLFNDDADEDGIPNFLDAQGLPYNDSDNDGISDDIECPGGIPCPDTDGDGQPDYMDEDDDNDGIDTIDEDANGDGDPTNDDKDGDNVPDYKESNVQDLDQDGLPDWDDKDDDGDNIDTIDEDANGDGDPTNDDDDGDGIPNYRDKSTGNGQTDNVTGSGDSDGDSLSDAQECPGGAPCPDTDADGIPNYMDDDDDNDNQLTQHEITELNGTVVSPADADADGVPNYLEPDNLDTDGDGNFNPNDPDDDGDGLVTGTVSAGIITSSGEVGPGGALDPIDTDGDNIPDYLESNITNRDGDNIPPNRDLDSDGDAIPDKVETGADFDGDGRPNSEDLDSDNDSINDVIEGNNSPVTTDANGDGLHDDTTDTNSNGLSDSVEVGMGGTPLPIPDIEGDGQPNYVDLDSDGDTKSDLVEAGDPTSIVADTNGNNNGMLEIVADGLADDTDEDGIMEPADADDTIYGEGSGGDTEPQNTIPTTAADYANERSDGIVLDIIGTPNELDDTNGDGVIDENDSGGGTDADNDGIDDIVDNAPTAIGGLEEPRIYSCEIFFLQDDVDKDVYDKTLEFVLGGDVNRGDHRVLGTEGRMGLILKTDGSTKVDVVWRRPTGLLDVTAKIETSTDMINWNSNNSLFLESNANSVFDHSDGTESVTWENVADYFGIGSERGYVRLAVTVPCALGVTSYTVPRGFHKRTLNGSYQTISTSFVSFPELTGIIDSVSGTNILNINTSLLGGDLDTLFAPTDTESKDPDDINKYYIEITDGSLEGERIDIASLTGNSIILDTSSIYSTIESVNGADGAAFVVRRHIILSEVMDPEEVERQLGDGVTGASADSFLMHDDAGFTSAIVTNLGDKPSWKLENGTPQDNQVIMPGVGAVYAFTPDTTHGANLGERRTITVGEARYNGFRRRFSDKAIYLTPGYPLELTPAQMGMNVANGFKMGATGASADVLAILSGDETPGGGNVLNTYIYSNLSLTPSWIHHSNTSPAPALEVDGAVFMKVATDKSYLNPTPWDTTVYNLPYVP